MAKVIGFVVAAVTLSELPRSSHSLLWMRSPFGEDAHLRSCYCWAVNVAPKSRGHDCDCLVLGGLLTDDAAGGAVAMVHRGCSGSLSAVKGVQHGPPQRRPHA